MYYIVRYNDSDEFGTIFDGAQVFSRSAWEIYRKDVEKMDFEFEVITAGEAIAYTNGKALLTKMIVNELTEDEYNLLRRLNMLQVGYFPDSDNDFVEILFDDDDDDEVYFEQDVDLDDK